MPKATLVRLCVILTLTQASCAFFAAGTERLAIGLSLIRSPVVVSLGEVNSALPDGARAQLEKLQEQIHAAQSSRLADGQMQAIGDVRRVGAVWSPLGVQRLPIEIDDYSDLSARVPLLVIALSGGGERAGQMAAHALAELEADYNKAAPGGAPLICRIDAFSTVSGGSLYASHVARQLVRHIAASAGKPTFLEKVRLAKPPRQQQNDATRSPIDPAVGLDCSAESKERNFFAELEGNGTFISGSRYLGGASAIAYFSPLNLFFLPLMTLFTDRGFADVLANTLTITHGDAAPFLKAATALGDLPQRPRFFFNALDTKNGAPVVLTQRIENISGRFTPPWAHDLIGDYKPDCLRPLASSLTLEDINSAPAAFPLAYAAVASAAFPPVVSPVAVRRFRYLKDAHEVDSSEDQLLLSDGGVFDNSGLTAAVDFTEFALHGLSKCGRTTPGPTRAVILAINAETSVNPAIGPTAELDPRPASDRVDLDWPFRRDGFFALDQLHFANKRRAEQIAVTRIRQDNGPAASIEYFSIDLSNLSHRHPGRVADRAAVSSGASSARNSNFLVEFWRRFLIRRAETPDPASEPTSDLFGVVKKIPTDYVLSKSNDAALDRAVTRLLSACHGPYDRSKDYPCTSDPGPDPKLPLRDAIMRAILR